ncbi:MAG: cation:proton antiporter [Acidobacteriota bacterium]|nr:cation:proton antiporter [Acidobacteriota bacterium]
MIAISVFVLLLFAYSLVSQRLERTILTAPMVFTIAGMVTYALLPLLRDVSMNASFFLHLAELGLVMLLFTDASRTELTVLRSMENLPARLLSTGLLLTILLGAVAARLVFPQLSVWEAGILGAILAPTDAGLGQVVVASPRVPVRVRQALNVEAGLNDGLSVPFLLFFIALAAARTEIGKASLPHFVAQQLGLGVLLGAVIGLMGGWSLAAACRRAWIAGPFLQIAVVTLPLLCLLVSEVLDASMFIAAFVAGLAVQVRFKDAGVHSAEFAEEWGQLINLSVFFLFGMGVVRNGSQFGWIFWVYAVISLTIVRMLPVALALIGTRLSAASVLFMGWFGPRGLASIVLGLVYLEQELHLPGESTMRLAVMVTVALSIFAHGLSAVPGISLYERKVTSLPAAAPEHQEAVLAATASGRG